MFERNSSSHVPKRRNLSLGLHKSDFFVWPRLPESQSCRAPKVVKSVLSPPEDLWMLGKVDSSNIMKSLLQIQERNLAWHRVRIPTAPWLPDPRLDQQQKSCADMASLKCGEPSLWTRWAVDLNHRRWVVGCRWSIYPYLTCWLAHQLQGTQGTDLWMQLLFFVLACAKVWISQFILPTVNLQKAAWLQLLGK